MNKTGRKYKIYEITPKDAKEFLELRNQTEKETDAMMFTRNERKTTMAEMSKKIKYYQTTLHGAVFVIKIDKKMSGFILIYGSAFKVQRKTMDIAMAVLKKHWGKGIGRALLEHAKNWAQKKNAHRLSLEVWSNNKRAIDLYLKNGYKMEGARKEHGIIKNKYVDMICMGQILRR